MSSELFTQQDAIDTAQGINTRIKDRHRLYSVPEWGDFVNDLSRSAYKELYHVDPSIDDGMREYVEFSETVGIVLRHECGSCVGELISRDATTEDAFTFNIRFGDWREKAITTISPEDDHPELREIILSAMSIDTVVSFANRTVEQIEHLLGKNYLTDRQRGMWQDLHEEWQFNSFFLETSRRMSMDLSGATLL